MALSALQTAGIATVVGVAGVGAYSFLSSPANDPAVSPSSYNPGEVVYVAGNPNSGVYQRGAYFSGQDNASGGPNESSVHITAKTLTRLQEAENREKAMAEMEEYEASNRPSSAPVAGGAYKGGSTEGLGMGANVANEMGLKGTGTASDPMAAVSGMMGNMQGMISQAQQQGQGGASGGKGGQGGKGDEEGAEANAPGLGALKSASMARAGSGGGSGAGSSFVIQNSNKNRRAPGAKEEDAGNVLNSAQEQLNKTMEGARMRAKASFGESEGLGHSKDATIMDVRNTKDGRDLRWMMERSNKVAMTKTRAANDGSDPFLSDTKVSGGMRIAAENVTTGAGQGTKDFEAEAVASLRGLGSWGGEQDNYYNQRKRDHDTLKTLFYVAITAAFVAIPLIIFFAGLARMLAAGVLTAPLAPAQWAIAGIIAGISCALLLGLIGYASYFTNKYGVSGLPLTTFILAPVLIGMEALAMFVPGVSGLFASVKLGIMVTVGAALGLGTTFLTDALTGDSDYGDSAGGDDSSLKNTEIES